MKNQVTVDELKSRDSFIVGISDYELSNKYDYKIQVQSGEYTEILIIIVFQLIAYYLSVEKCINADFPRD